MQVDISEKMVRSRAQAALAGIGFPNVIHWPTGMREEYSRRLWKRMHDDEYLTSVILFHDCTGSRPTTVKMLSFAAKESAVEIATALRRDCIRGMGIV